MVYVPYIAHNGDTLRCLWRNSFSHNSLSFRRFCVVSSPSAVTEYKACEHITLRTWLSRSVTSRHVTLSRMQSALLEYASLEIQSKATRSVGTPSTSHIRYHTSVIIITPDKEKGTIYLGETGLYMISIRSERGWANSRG